MASANIACKRARAAATIRLGRQRVNAAFEQILVKLFAKGLLVGFQRRIDASQGRVAISEEIFVRGEVAHPLADAVIIRGGKICREHCQQLRTHLIEAAPSPSGVNPSRNYMALAHPVERLDETVKAAPYAPSLGAPLNAERTNRKRAIGKRLEGGCRRVRSAILLPR